MEKESQEVYKSLENFKREIDLITELCGPKVIIEKWKTSLEQDTKQLHKKIEVNIE